MGAVVSERLSSQTSYHLTTTRPARQKQDLEKTLRNGQTRYHLKKRGPSDLCLVAGFGRSFQPASQPAVAQSLYRELCPIQSPFQVVTRA